MAVGGVSQEWFTAAELAELGLPGLATSKRGVQLQAGREGWDNKVCGAGRPLCRKRQARGGGVEYHQSILPAEARAKLTLVAVPVVDPASAWQRWDRSPEALKAEAQRRVGILNRVEALVAAGHRKSQAIDLVVGEARRKAQAEGGECGVSASTVHGWFRKVAGVDLKDRAAYLTPEYTGRQVTAECSDDAWQLFKADFLRQSNLSAAACYRNVERMAAEKGWTLPSLKTLQRRLDAEVTPAQQTLLRKGEKALLHTFPHLTREKPAYPMQVINLDGHTWDVLVEWPGGLKARPVCLAVQDIHSGKFLALRFDLTLNHHLVRLALGDTFREYGLAEKVYMDNGRENAARAISGGQHRLRWGNTPEQEPAGLLETLGVQSQWASPYWGQAKPIERGFRDFAHDIAKQAFFDGAYTGHNTVNRPENHRSRAIPFAEFEAFVRARVAFHNAQTGRRGIGMNGRSFDQAFADGMAGRAVRTLTAEQLRTCMLASKPCSMDRQSGAVTVEGHRYWSPALGDLKRQKVTVRFDPERMDLPAYVYALDGRFLVEAKRLGAGSFDNLSDGREQRRALREHARGVKIQAQAVRTLTPAAVAAEYQKLTPPALPPIEQGNLVRPAFGTPRAATDIGAAPATAAPVTDFDARWERGLAASQEAG